MRTEAGQIYVCKVCGNKVQVLESGGGVLVCCGVPMKHVAEGK
jgi:superoxide reductase